jgi:hypothetical protein
VETLPSAERSTSRLSNLSANAATGRMFLRRQDLFVGAVYTEILEIMLPSTTPSAEEYLAPDRGEVAVIIVGLIVAVALAALAVFLTTTRGNRLADFNQRDNGALNLELYNQFKIATGAPIVALYFFSIIAGLGLPALAYGLRYRAYTTALADYSAAQMSGSGAHIILSNSLSREPKNVCVESADVNVNMGARRIDIPLQYTTAMQSFIIDVDDWNNPITLNAMFLPGWGRITRDLSGTDRKTVSVVGNEATVPLPLPTMSGVLATIQSPQNQIRSLRP